MKLADLIGSLGAENAPKKKQLSRRVSGLERIMKAYTALVEHKQTYNPLIDFDTRAEDVETFANMLHLLPIYSAKIDKEEYFKTAFLNKVILACVDKRIDIAPKYRLYGLLSGPKWDDVKKDWVRSTLYAYEGQPKIIVRGALDGRCFSFMKKGIAHVYGNAMDYFGEHMKDGELTIHGSVNNRAGTEMTGGILRITGRAGKDLASLAKGGTVYAKSAQTFGYKAAPNVTFHLQEPSTMSLDCQATVYIAGKKVMERGKNV